MVNVYLVASRDMYARCGLSAAVPSAAAMQMAYEHIRSTGVFRVAESGGRIVAIAGAILRDRIWFLSAFWALPEVQRQNIGMPLLREVWHEGAAAGATTFFTWASPDLAALASYMKLGMLPGYGIFVFQGIPQHLPPTPSCYQPGPLEHQVATAFDLDVRGTRREVDHRFWAGAAGLCGRQVLRDGKVVGYYYLNQGTIGPAAWIDATEAAAVVGVALYEAAEGAAESGGVTLVVPGINHAALRIALASGLRLTVHSQFLTSAPFGRLERYLPSGPLLY